MDRAALPLDRTFSFDVVSVTAFSSELTSNGAPTPLDNHVIPLPPRGRPTQRRIRHVQHIGRIHLDTQQPILLLHFQRVPFFSKPTTGFSGFHCAHTLVTAPKTTNQPRHNTANREPFMPAHPFFI